MAKLFFIGPILPPSGAGTINDSYRSSVSTIDGTAHRAVIPTFSEGANIGKPKYNFCFGKFAFSNAALIAQLPNTLVFPDYPLDATMDGMDAEVRTALKQSIEAYVLDAQGTRFSAAVALDDSASYRDLIDSLGRQLDPAYSSALEAEPREVA